MKIRTFKETKHSYKGYEIIGSSRQTEGGYVLGGRHYKEGGSKRNYNIKKDGKFRISPNEILETLREAKEFIDRLLIPRDNKHLDITINPSTLS